MMCVDKPLIPSPNSGGGTSVSPISPPNGCRSIKHWQTLVPNIQRHLKFPQVLELSPGLAINRTWQTGCIMHPIFFDRAHFCSAYRCSYQILFSINSSRAPRYQHYIPEAPEDMNVGESGHAIRSELGHVTCSTPGHLTGPPGHMTKSELPLIQDNAAMDHRGFYRTPESREILMFVFKKGANNAVMPESSTELFVMEDD